MPNVKTQTPEAWAAATHALTRKGTGVDSTSSMMTLGSAAAQNVSAFEPAVAFSSTESGPVNLAASDNRKFLRFTHAAPTLTVPLQASVTFPDEFLCWGSFATGGTITIPSGGTINGVNNASVAVGAETDGAGFTLRRTASNTWVLILGSEGGGAGEVDVDAIADAFNADDYTGIVVLPIDEEDEDPPPALAAGQLLQTVAEIAPGLWGVEPTVPDELDTDPDQFFPTDSAGEVVGVTVAASRILGRKATGDVGALTGAEAAVVIGSATTSASGVVELATTAEINTGTDTGRAIGVDEFAASNLATAVIEVECFGPTSDVTTGDGAAYVTIPACMTGMNLIRAQATVVTAGTTNATTVMVHNLTDGADMLSGAISIASAGVAGTVGTVNTSTDDVATNDRIRIDVDSVSTTKPKGLTVILEFRLP